MLTIKLIEQEISSDYAKCSNKAVLKAMRTNICNIINVLRE